MKKLMGMMALLLIVAMTVVGCGSNPSSEGNEAADEPGKPANLTVLAGTAGGSWMPIGAAVAEIFSDNGVKANSEQGGGVSNVTAISRGEGDIGFTMTIIPSIARAGEQPFDGVYDNVAGLAVLFPNFNHVMVGPEVNSLEDLKGKGFVTQPVGHATQVAFRDLLAAYGMTEDDLKLTRGSQTEGVELMKDGHVIGLTATTAAPGGSLTELATSKDIKFLGVDDEHLAKLKEINDGYVRTNLKPNTYPGQTEEVQGVGTDTVLIVRKDMSDEEVYWITKTLAENIQKLKDSHACMADLTLEQMASVTGVSMHPGAQKYWDEVLNK
ncbi:MAG: TAXI family TRAP transporter solute-binding subunit [bacterium]|jgi:TRAP transporter TAXI family solute receptor